MFSKYLKAILVFNRSQNKAPNFVLVYLIIWLVWHNNFFVLLALSKGDIWNRLLSALLVSEHQYISVLFLTLSFFIFRLSCLYFLNKTNTFIEEEESIEYKIGSDQSFQKNKDIVRLLDLLEEAKSKLIKAKEAEALAKLDKTATISQCLSIKSELEIAMADIAILVKSNEELKSELKKLIAA